MNIKSIWIILELSTNVFFVTAIIRDFGEGQQNQGLWGKTGELLRLI